MGSGKRLDGYSLGGFFAIGLGELAHVANDSNQNLITDQYLISISTVEEGPSGCSFG